MGGPNAAFSVWVTQPREAGMAIPASVAFTTPKTRLHPLQLLGPPVALQPRLSGAASSLPASATRRDGWPRRSTQRLNHLRYPEFKMSPNGQLFVEVSSNLSTGFLSEIECARSTAGQTSSGTPHPVRSPPVQKSNTVGLLKIAPST